MHKSVFILLSAIVAISANSQELIGTLADEILSNNTELASFRLRNDAERTALKSNNNLADPEFEFGHQWGQDGIGNKWSVELSQSFEWPGVYSARSEANKATALTYDYLDQSKASEIRYSAMNLLVDIYYGKKQIDMISTMLVRIDSLMAVCRKGVSTGDISRLDLNKLKIERINVASRLNEAAVGYEAVVNELKGLNGGKSIGEIVDRLQAYSPVILQPIDNYMHKIQTNNPTIRYAQAMDNAEIANEKVVKRSRIPGFSIGLNHEYEMGDHFNGITFGLTLPLFSNRNKQSEIRTRRIALQSEIYHAETVASSEIRSAYEQIKALDDMINQYKTVLGDSDNLRLLDVALNAQHMTMLDYLLEYNYFIEAESQYIETCRQRDKQMNVLLRW